MDVSEIQKGDSLGDFFDTLLPRGGVTPEFFGKVLVFGIVVAFVSGISNYLHPGEALKARKAQVRQVRTGQRRAAGLHRRWWKGAESSVRGRTSKVGRILRGEDISQLPGASDSSLRVGACARRRVGDGHVQGQRAGVG